MQGAPPSDSIDGSLLARDANHRESSSQKRQETQKTMRPAILMGGACAVFAFACTPAFAQGTVTLYGLLDAGVNYLSNAQTGRHDGKLEGGSKYSLEDGSTGGQNGSRWGLLGTE